MSGPVSPPLTVEEIDGTPSGRPINTIKVSNGSLTISGTTATITTGGGGGGAITSFDVAGDSGAAQSVGDADTVTFAGGTGLSSGASATDTITFNLDNTAVTAGSYTYTSLTVDAQGRITSASSGTAPAVDGSGAATQVAYWSDSDTITGSANLTFDGTNLAVGGYVKSGTGVFDTEGTTDLVLQTNGGTNSGTITISDGTNGQISISPNGTGEVITGNYRFDVDETVGAGQDGYALTYTNSTGNISLKEVGGGGNEFNAELCGVATDTTGTNYDVFDILSLPPFGQASYTTGQLDGKRTFYPFLSPVSGDLDTLYWNMSAAASSAQNIYAGVWADNEGIPGTMLGYVTIDATASGSQSSSTWSSTVTLVRGTQYHFGCNRSNSESHTYRACQTTGRPRVAPDSGFPSTNNSWGTGFVTTGTITGVPVSVDADDLERIVVFGSLNYPMHIGVTFS